MWKNWQFSKIPQTWEFWTFSPKKYQKSVKISQKEGENALLQLPIYLNFQLVSKKNDSKAKTNLRNCPSSNARCPPPLRWGQVTFSSFFWISGDKNKILKNPPGNFIFENSSWILTANWFFWCISTYQDVNLHLKCLPVHCDRHYSDDDCDTTDDTDNFQLCQFLFS